MENIMAIITTYYPNQTHVENVKRIAAQVDSVIVFDNSRKENKMLFTDISNCRYQCEERNLGLSVAFNKVLCNPVYNWSNDDFIIFFDQDSKIDKDHISKLVEEYCLLEKLGYKIGCLGPVFFNNSNQRLEVPKIKENITEHNMKVGSNITSSLLCRYHVLKTVGFWNEKIFLDMADWDICWRMINKGFLCCMTDRTVLNHSVGEGEKKIGPIKLRVGKPFREYYQTRDCLYLLKEKYVPFKMKLRFIAMITVRPVIHVLFLDEARLRMEYIKKGLRDYKSKIYGEVNID